MDHSHYKDKRSFYKGKVEKSYPLPWFFGHEVWEMVSQLPKIMEKNEIVKFPIFGEKHN